MHTAATSIVLLAATEIPAATTLKVAAAVIVIAAIIGTAALAVCARRDASSNPGSDSSVEVFATSLIAIVVFVFGTLALAQLPAT